MIIYIAATKDVNPAIISVRRFVPFSLSLKKPVTITLFTFSWQKGFISVKPKS
jgi:hypothetical protein